MPLPEPCRRAAGVSREAKGVRRGAGRRGSVLSTGLPGPEAHHLLDVCGLQAGPGSQLLAHGTGPGAFTGPCVGGPVLGVRDDSWGHAPQRAAPPLPPLSLAGCVLRGLGGSLLGGPVWEEGAAARSSRDLLRKAGSPRAAGCGTDVDRLVGHGGDDPVAGGRTGPGCYRSGKQGRGGGEGWPLRPNQHSPQEPTS